jgi:NAD(P)-dependent dehydrogenase (short-subunit alcohol dehydrogenase family)
MNAHLKGKTVLVTGATSGIGLSTALAFAEAGAAVVATGRREEAVSEARQKHPGIHWLVSDLTSEAAARSSVEEAVRATRRLDVLVNNGAIYTVGSLEAMSSEAMMSLFATNVFGLSYMSRAALPHLRETRGAIINISSALGHMASPNMSHYAATKAAVESLTRSWALELAPLGVRVNAVSPGAVETPIFDKAGMSPEVVTGYKEKLAKDTPLGRLGRPEEIAHWVVALAEPMAEWMTGKVLGVDGGLGT